MKELSLYIHIPFCEKKCYYCDFISYTDKSSEEIDLYIDSIIKEISIYSRKVKDYKISTIFFGGGTPSCIDGKHIERIMNHIEKNFNTNYIEEVTIEINPGTLDKEKALIYKRAGINRVSLGLQTTDDKMLRTIGRIHNYKKFLESFNILKEAEFNNINVDLIFGLPDQTKEDVILDLKRITDLGVEHISYYSLILEGDTPMERWAEEGRYNFPDDIEDRKMYHGTVEYLKENGYKHYEISNFAKPGYESIHNKVYWQIKPYIGIGVGSHSNIFNKRFSNETDINRYMDKLNNDKLAIIEEEDIDKKMEIAEYCIFGCRIIEGIDRKDFYNRFNKQIDDIYGDMLKKHMDNGLLLDDGIRIRLTNKGLDLANLVEMDFLP